MTKTLTEQWRDGTLRGCFYWKLPNGNICTAYTDTMRDIKKVRDSEEVEVLQETPSYVEYKHLQEQLADASKKVKELEEQLKKAQNLIIYCSSGDHLGYEVMCENYMHKYHLSKWGVK